MDDEEDYEPIPYNQLTHHPPPGGNGVGYVTTNLGRCSTVYKNGVRDGDATLALWKEEDRRKTLPAEDPESFYHPFYKLGRDMAQKLEDETFKTLLDKPTQS